MTQMRLNLGHELVVDLFAGGGGASEGIRLALGRDPDVAVNHDPEAVAVHAANHPATVHYIEDVFRVDPVVATGNRPVGLLWASPDCTHHSKARGGKPRSKKVRSLAWVVVRWARRVRPRVIALENVEEFQDWGPLTEDGRPCPLRRGQTFRHFVAQLERQGYRVEHRELRACDYGAPTIRRRLFLIARRDGLPIRWPAPTHGDPASDAVKRGRLLPWRTAAECIDWSIPAPSIFERSRPLAENTMKRIARGVQRFVLEAAEPFIVGLAHGDHRERPGSRSHGLDEPLRTVHAGGNNHALAVPYFIPRHGEREGQDPRTRAVTGPMPTVTATANGATLVTPYIVGIDHQSSRSSEHPLGAPLSTVTGKARHAVVAAFLAKHYGGVTGIHVCQPTGTVTTQDHHAVVATHLLNLKGSDRRHRAMDTPAPTITAGGTHAAMVAALLAPYYGSGSGTTGRDLRDPAPTVTARDRLQLVTVKVDGETYVLTDIGMRMLQPRELFRAQGFGDHYIIDHGPDGRKLSKAAQVRLCGNSVCPPLAAAIVAVNFAHEAAWMDDEAAA
jgi:DNA (cytosine-5)-methyltransferase 1